MIADGRDHAGRHRRGHGADQHAGSKLASWRRVAAAGISLAIASITFVALSSPAGAAETLARATLVNADGVQVGKVLFKGMGKYADRVRVDINAPKAEGLGSFHGLHIHSVGDCRPEAVGDPPTVFGLAGGHWNPGAVDHGAHAGDLPSVLLTSTGQAYAEFETARFSVDALLDAANDGSAVVLHAGPDNFGNIPSSRYWYNDPTAGPVPGPDATTKKTGDADGRYACGVIEAIN